MSRHRSYVRVYADVYCDPTAGIEPPLNHVRLQAPINNDFDAWRESLLSRQIIASISFQIDGHPDNEH